MTELLVVVGIVVCLASLLLVAVQNVTEKGRAAFCTNNLHQIGTLAALYRAENGKPVAASVGVAPDATNWSGLLYALSIDAANSGDATKAMRTKAYDVFWCPSFVKTYGRADANSAGRSSYSINVYFSGAFPNVIDGGRNEPYIIDGTIRTDGQKMALNAVQQADAGVGYHHAGHANALYYDGSVRTLSTNDVANFATDLSNRNDFK